MKDTSKLPKRVQKELSPHLEDVLSIRSVFIDELRSKFELEKKSLIKKGRQPTVRWMYHLTDSKSAKGILEEGFDPKRSFYKAFGIGINLCPKLKNVLKYRKMRKSKSNKVSVIISKVLIGNAHGNSSDVNNIIKEKNGSSYSKPLYMKPKRGFDSMYSLRPYKEIWIIPSKFRVLPVYEVELRYK